MNPDPPTEKLGAAPADAAAPVSPIGLRLLHYEIVSRLGAGGMGDANLDGVRRDPRVLDLLIRLRKQREHYQAMLRR
jgi:hypothetical protein